MTRRIRSLTRLLAVGLLLAGNAQLAPSSPAFAADRVLAPVNNPPPPAQPNLANARAEATSINHVPRENVAAAPVSNPPPQVITHPLTLSMQSGRVDIDPAQGGHFTGSDGRLEVSIPAAAISPADVAERQPCPRCAGQLPEATNVTWSFPWNPADVRAGSNAALAAAIKELFGG